MKYVEVQRDTACLQIPLSRLKIEEICSSHLNETPNDFVFLSTGKFNTSYLLTFTNQQDRILRVAPPHSAPLFRHEKYLLRREHGIQSKLADVSSLFPKNMVADFSHELVQRDYVVQNRLPGILWGSIENGLSKKMNKHIWTQLAPVIAAVHQIEGTRFGFPSPAISHATWGGAIIDWIRGMILDMKELHICSLEAQTLQGFAEKGIEFLNEVRQPTLVHGDLWPKNILLVDEPGNAKVAGILDAERAFWGEPASEWIFSFLDIPQAFWDRYGQIPEDVSAHFRKLIYVGRGAIQLCLEARRFNFDDSFAKKILAETNTRLAKYFRAASII